MLTEGAVDDQRVGGVDAECRLAVAVAHLEQVLQPVRRGPGQPQLPAPVDLGEVQLVAGDAELLPQPHAREVVVGVVETEHQLRALDRS